MKADDLKFIVSDFANIPEMVPGVHVGLTDTKGPTIFSILKGPRYAKPNLFLECQKQLTADFEASAFIIT